MTALLIFLAAFWALGWFAALAMWGGLVLATDFAVIEEPHRPKTDDERTWLIMHVAAQMLALWPVSLAITVGHAMRPFWRRAYADALTPPAQGGQVVPLPRPKKNAA